MPPGIGDDAPLTVPPGVTRWIGAQRPRCLWLHAGVDRHVDPPWRTVGPTSPTGWNLAAPGFIVPSLRTKTLSPDRPGCPSRRCFGVVATGWSSVSYSWTFAPP